jgi:hypothetical protein
VEECRGNAYNFDFNSKRHRNSLYQRYLKEDGRDCEGCHFLLANCLEMDDPDHDERLRSHTGFHPLTMLSRSNFLEEAI